MINNIKKIQVCHGPTCGTHGAQKIKQILQEEYKDQSIEVVERECCGRCKYNNTIIVDDVAISRLSPENIKEEFIKDPASAIEKSKKEDLDSIIKLESFLASDDLLE